MDGLLHPDDAAFAGGLISAMVSIPSPSIALDMQLIRLLQESPAIGCYEIPITLENVERAIRYESEVAALIERADRESHNLLLMQKGQYAVNRGMTIWNRMKSGIKSMTGMVSPDPGLVATFHKTNEAWKAASILALSGWRADSITIAAFVRATTATVELLGRVRSLLNAGSTIYTSAEQVD